jgi:hypothetical protein
MTSIKKPLIAIASAVALVMTAVVAVPASAATVAISGGNWVASSSTDGTTAKKAVTLPVPADNSVDAADVLTISVSSAEKNSNVVVVATNAKVVTELTDGDDVVKANAGLASVSVATGTGTTATIYAYTTSTSAGSVSVSIGGNTTVYHVKGSAGTAYTLSVTAPTFAGLGSDANFTATAKDVFGNVVENAVITTTVLRGSVKTELAWNSTDKVYKGILTVPSTAGSEFGVAQISATAVDGFAKPVKEVSFTVNVLDLNDAITAANAKIAKLKKRIENLKKKNKKLKKNK